MDDIAKLGFEIDTSGLAKASTAAKSAVQDLGKVADAADAASRKITETGKASAVASGSINSVSNSASNAATKVAAAGAAQEKLADALGRTVPAANAEAKAAEEAAKKTEGLGDAAKRTHQQAASLAASLQRVGSVGQRLTGEIGNLSQSFGIATGSAGGVALNGALRASSGLIEGLTGMMGRFGAVAGPVIGSVVAIGGTFIGLQAALAGVQDRWASYEGQLKNTLGSTTAARNAIDALYKSAQGSGISFDSTVQSFNRLARNATELGATNDEILQLSSTIQKLGVISGAGQGEIASGMLQLSQALAAGKLNGDELRSIMENMPALAKAIADGLGVSVGALRSMGAAGELAGDKVFRALLGNTEKVQKEFENMPDTTERAFQRVSDSWSRMIARMGKAMDSSGTLQSLLKVANAAIGLMTPDGNVVTAEARRLGQLQAERARVEDLPGREGERRRARLDADIARLEPLVRAQREKDAAEADKSRTDEAFRPALGLFARGATAAKAVQMPSGTRSEIEDQIRSIENALIAAGQRGTESTLPVDQRPRRAQIEGMEAALVSLRQKLEDASGSMGKMSRESRDFAEQMRIGGGGGGLGIVAEAQQIARQSRTEGAAAGAGGIIAQIASDRARRSATDITSMDRQTEQQRKLAEQIGMTRDETREAEISQEALNWRFQQFGTITTGAVERAVANYTSALRRAKTAQDELSDARARAAMEDQLAVVAAGTAAIAGGEYAVRRAEMTVRARQAERQAPGSSVLRLREFEAGEGRSVEQQLQRLRQQAEQSDAAARATSSVGLREMSLQQRIADAQRNAPPERAGEIAAAMRKSDEASTRASLQQQTVSLREQVDLQQQQLKLVGLEGEERSVQQALLQKRVDLQRQGVDLQSEEARILMQETELAARSGFRLSRVEQDAEEYGAIWKTASAGVSRSISDAFLSAFDKTKSAADVLRQGLSDVFKRMAADILQQAFKPLQDALTSLLRSMATSLAGAFGIPTAAPAANGAWFAGGHAAFASGGVFTNRVVSSPTMFRFADGGVMRSGLMGEAGPEAIMPLRRGADGRLGVSAAGGQAIYNVSISVDAGGATRSEAGPDDNESRAQRLGEVVSAAVRAELVQQQRPGGILARR